MNQKIEETGLPQVGDAYFMWRSTTGKIHAINPENKKTFCGLTVKQSWEPTDVLSDKTHEPNCPKCKDHYLDPLRKDIEGIITELKECINEFLSVQLWTLNANGGLGRFTETIAKFTREETKRAKEEKQDEEQFEADYKHQFEEEQRKQQAIAEEEARLKEEAENDICPEEEWVNEEFCPEEWEE